jgi:alpha/beta hydrolase fold.
VNIVVSVEQALDKLGTPKAPLVLVGHSRGGRLAVEAAAYLIPERVVASSPGSSTRRTSCRRTSA